MHEGMVGALFCWGCAGWFGFEHFPAAWLNGIHHWFAVFFIPFSGSVFNGSGEALSQG